MNPAQLSATIVSALTTLSADGRLTLPDGVPATVVVERPRSKEHGDYATNVALQLGKKAGLSPRDLAGMLAEQLVTAEGISAVDVAGPGFLNITVETGAQGQVAADVVAAGDLYGHTEVLAGQKINVEFISANPTGPLHLGHTRWAVLGDAIGRVLSAAGAEVTREFYINDRGVQMNHFADSIIASALGLPKPEDGYAGGYIDDARQGGRGGQPRHLRAARRRAPRRRTGQGLRAAARRPAAVPRALQHPLRRLVLRAVPARLRLGARDVAAAAGPGSRLHRGRSAVDAHHRLR